MEIKPYWNQQLWETEEQFDEVSVYYYINKIVKLKDAQRKYPWLTGKHNSSAIIRANNFSRAGGIANFMSERKKRFDGYTENQRKREIMQENVGSFLYNDYLQSDYWKELREKVLVRDNRQCVLCKNQNNLHVHHNSYRERGFGIEKEMPHLITLCEQCHRVFHEQMLYNSTIHLFFPKELDELYKKKQENEFPGLKYKPF